MIARVAVNDATIHFDKLYSYRVPPELEAQLWPGGIVLVPFGRGDAPRMAVVLETGSEDEPSPKLKSVLAAAPEDARLTPDLLELVRFLKDRYFCTWYEAVKVVIPYGAQYRPGVKDGRPVVQSRLTRPVEQVYELAAPLPEKPKPGPRQKMAADLLQVAGTLTRRELEEQGVAKTTLDALCKKGVLRVSERYKSLDLFASIPFDPQPVELSAEQQAAYDQLAADLAAGSPARGAALWRPRAAAKRRCLVKLIERTLELGRRALVLVPEIGLTPQMIRRLKSMFGSRLAVQHSALNNTERLLQWRMIQRGDADIVVGTRSAVFAPLQNIGLIILDEEQEHTYQSESAPRYSAHEVARKRAAAENALLVFASATPRTETTFAAQSGRIRMVTLKNRYGGRPLPGVEFADMRAELASGNPREVSARLAEELAENLRRGEQSILLLNRRGYNTVAMCTDCGRGSQVPQLQRAARLPQKPRGAFVPPLRPYGAPRAPRCARRAAASSRTAASAPSAWRRNCSSCCPQRASCAWTRIPPPRKTRTNRCWPALPGRSMTFCLAHRWSPKGWTLKKSRSSAFLASIRCCSGRGSARMRACSASSPRSSAAAAAPTCPAVR